MSVSPMKAISIIGLIRDFDKVINILGASQAFEPEPVTSFYTNTEKFQNFSEANRYSELLTEFDGVLMTAGLEPELVDISGFKPKEEALFGYCESVIEECDRYMQEISSKEAEKENCIKKIEQTSHFSGVKLDMDRLQSCQYIKPRFGRIPVESMRYLDRYKDNPYVMFIQTSVDRNYCWGAYMVPVDREEEIDRIFSGMLFENCDVSQIEGTPEEYIKTQTARKEKLEKEIEQSKGELKSFIEKNREEILRYYTKLTEKAIYQGLKSHAMVYNSKESSSFVICGWLPDSEFEAVEKKLKKIKSVEWQTDDAINQLEKSPPIKLKNSCFAKPYSFYVEMYGVPKYNEIDPTLFVAITYTVLFGAMFGDFGHGIVLSIAGVVMYKLKGFKVGKIIVPCGISSAIFGLIFGSCFGFEDAFNGLYKELFSLDEKPIEVMGRNIIDVILVSVAVGIFLLILAMCLNIYSSFKQKDMAKAIFGSNGIAGLVLYTTVCVGISSILLLDANIFNIVTILLLIIVPLVLIFLAEPLGKLAEGNKRWKPEKWGDYCVQSGFEMFEVILSYLSNTMSFLRVGAFVMVHAGMMEVVFTLIGLVGGVTSVAGILVLIFGNLFVIALEGLLVSIQTLRLEFYEMFSRFYSGTGRPYNPVTLKKLNTK